MKRKLLISCLILSSLLMSGCGKEKMESGYAAAREKMLSGAYTEAAKSFAEAAPNNNSSAEFYVDYGMNSLELQQYDLAIECFDHAISLEGALEDAYRGLGLAYYEQEKYDSARNALNLAIDQVGFDIGAREYDILQYRGACELKLSEYDAALTTYEALLALGVNKDQQYLQIGKIYLALHNKAKALEYFDMMNSSRKESIEYYFRIYQCFVDAGYKDEGTKYLSKALEIDGSSDEAHLWRGKIYYLMGNNSAALTELTYPLEKQNHEAALYTAFCYEALGEYAKAEEVYYDELNRQYDPVMVNYLALCLTKEEKYKMAWNLVHAAIADYPDCSCIQELLWNEVVLYEKMGYYPSAYTHLLDYQKRYPNDPLIEQELSFLLMKQS